MWWQPQLTNPPTTVGLSFSLGRPRRGHRNRCATPPRRPPSSRPYLEPACEPRLGRRAGASAGKSSPSCSCAGADGLWSPEWHSGDCGQCLGGRLGGGGMSLKSREPNGRRKSTGAPRREAGEGRAPRRRLAGRSWRPVSDTVTEASTQKAI